MQSDGERRAAALTRLTEQSAGLSKRRGHKHSWAYLRQVERFASALTSRNSSHTMVKTQKYSTYSVTAGPEGGGGWKSTSST
ncbi:hypothetical protein EYF80_035509 [Liparis tanakae]|uniref:Uncharacterized protein n=1 Tax=Liparis tanakae TaxID=230148 RepID=A0A4Z2GM30_9TELE|nr:hypothetical protein EYF80_035509 [Liparis tanakae]